MKLFAQTTDPVTPAVPAEWNWYSIALVALLAIAVLIGIAVYAKRRGGTPRERMGQAGSPGSPGATGTPGTERPVTRPPSNGF